MTREEKYAWMRQKQEEKKGAKQTGKISPKPGTRQDKTRIGESKYAWMQQQQLKKAQAKQAEKDRREQERAKARAAAELVRAEAKQVRQRMNLATEAKAVVSDSAGIVGFTWGTPLLPRTRDQVKRACAWHKRRKNDATRVRCACGECPACRLRAKQTEKVRRWRAAKKEAA
jgi:hypothetical protein